MNAVFFACGRILTQNIDTPLRFFGLVHTSKVGSKRCSYEVVWPSMLNDGMFVASAEYAGDILSVTVGHNLVVVFGSVVLDATPLV